MEGPSQTKHVKIQVVICLALTAAVFAVYGRVATHDFVNYDDPLYITGNANVQEGLTLENVKWAFQASDEGNWIPLTWISHMAAVEVFGLNAGAHLLLNVLLHALNSILLFLALGRMTGRIWPSALVAALFALHPLHIESVAWVAERKDVLSTLFWMLTIMAYIRYAERPTMRRYAAVVALFTIGLLTKSMLVTLPCVLLLLDYWPLQRVAQPTGTQGTPHADWTRLIVEKLPLLAIAAAIAAVTMVTQRSVGAMGSLEAVPLVPRILNAGASYAIYLRQTIWPFDLAVFYPWHTESVLPKYALIGALLVFAGLLASALMWKRRPYIAVGWLWYLGTLVPVIGLVSVGEHSHADRYTYLPLVGIFIMVAWTLADFVGAEPKRRAGALILTVALLLGLSLRSWDQIGHWRNSATLFEHALRVTPDNAVAHSSHGHALFGMNDLEGAVYHHLEAVRLQPWKVEYRYHLTLAYSEQGETLNAKWVCYEAIRIDPEHIETRRLLGNILLGEEDFSGAMDQFSHLLDSSPNDLAGRINLAIALAGLGRSTEAEQHFLEALLQEPGNPDAHYNYALLLIQSARNSEAIHHLHQALRSRPNHAQAQRQLDLQFGHAPGHAPAAKTPELR